MENLQIDFTPEDAAILLIDHQPGVLAMAKSLPAELITANVAILARLGEELRLPLLVTSTRETVPFLGPNIGAIKEAAPRAYNARVRRGGTINAFDDPAFVQAVERLGRKNLIMAGILTDVCLLYSVSSARKAGYNVKVVADASGSATQLADSISYERMQLMGAVPTTTFSMLFELFPDLSRSRDQQAEAIATEVLMKLKEAA